MSRLAALALVVAAGHLAAAEQAEAVVGVTVHNSEGGEWRTLAVPGEWIMVSGSPWLRAPYRGGRELRLKWEKPRLFVQVDGGPRQLLGILVDAPGGLEALGEAVAEGASPLTIWCHSSRLLDLPRVPEHLDVALEVGGTEWFDVATVAARVPGLRALSVQLPYPLRDRDAQVLSRLRRLTSLCFFTRGRAVTDLAPLARLKGLEVLQAA